MKISKWGAQKKNAATGAKIGSAYIFLYITNSLFYVTKLVRYHCQSFDKILFKIMEQPKVFMSVGSYSTTQQNEFIECIQKRLSSENLNPNTVGRNKFG